MSFNFEAYVVDSDYAETVIDDAKHIGAIMGIDVDDVRYSGFWSQGDGASFTGSYAYVKGAAAAIRAEAPNDAALHAIADTLQRIQARHFYQLTATISQSGHYSHEYTMSVDAEDARDSYRDIGNADEELTEAFRDFARWIYRSLEREYEYASAWQLAVAYVDLKAAAATEKAAARQLVRDMRKVGYVTPFWSVARDAVRRHLDAMAEALTERAEIADNFHYWDDGKSVDVEAFAAANV